MDKIAVFHSDFPLGAVCLMQCSLKLLKTTLSIIDLLLDKFALLLQTQFLVMIVHLLLLSLLEFKSNSISVLFRLGLGLVKLINLISKLRDGSIVFLSQHCQSGLMS